VEYGINLLECRFNLVETRREEVKRQLKNEIIKSGWGTLKGKNGN